MIGLDCTKITGGSILGELSRMLILILMVFLVMVMLLMMMMTMMMILTKTTMMTCGLCQVSRARQVEAMWGGEAIVFA